MEKAKILDVTKIVEFYRNVIDEVNKTKVKLGWNIDIYPDKNFVEEAINNNQMLIIKDGENILAAAVVNHNVNDEYNDINWDMCAEPEKIATIHALATSPECRGIGLSDRFLNEIGDYCKANGDLAIHLDVIDTNTPAYHLYLRNNYKEIDCIEMYYEVVGTRQFWMLEKVL